MPATHDDHTPTITFQRKYSHRQVTLREEALQQALRAMAVYGSLEATMDIIGEMLIESILDSVETFKASEAAMASDGGIPSRVLSMDVDVLLEDARRIADTLLNTEELTVDDRRNAFLVLNLTPAKQEEARKLDEERALKIANWFRGNDIILDHA